MGVVWGSMNSNFAWWVDLPMSLLKSRGNSDRMVFNSCFWSCVRLVEVVVGIVSLIKFCTVIGSVDGFVLRWRKGNVMLRHEVSFFAKLMMNPNCWMMLRPRIMSYAQCLLSSKIINSTFSSQMLVLNWGKRILDRVICSWWWCTPDDDNAE